MDGVGDAARLQHCLGLAYGGNTIYVADSYNNKIRALDPKTQTLKTLAGGKSEGTTDKPARFDEPGGLSLAGKSLYIADTNNSAIRALDLDPTKTGACSFHELALDGGQWRAAAERHPDDIALGRPRERLGFGHEAGLVIDQPNAWHGVDPRDRAAPPVLGKRVRRERDIAAVDRDPGLVKQRVL